MKFYYIDNILFSEKPPKHISKYSVLSEEETLKKFGKEIIDEAIEKRYIIIKSFNEKKEELLKTLNELKNADWEKFCEQIKKNRENRK